MNYGKATLKRKLTVIIDIHNRKAGKKTNKIYNHFFFVG